MNYTNEHVNCNICDSDESVLLAKKGHFNLPTNLVVCKKCGLGYLNPRWDKEGYSFFYRNDYDKYYRPSLLKKNTKGQYYQDNPILKRIEKHGVLSKSPVNILDIGSGEGKNLLAFGEKFSEAQRFAIEPSTVSQEILKSKNISILSDDVDSNWDKNYQAHFDFVIMRHVLEHFLDPSEVLNKVHRVLKNDGILYIAVPDNLNDKRNEGWLRVPHTYYFNIHTLENLLKKESFKTKYISAGDGLNRHEVFVFAEKAITPENFTIDSNLFNQQKSVFEEVLKKESTLVYKLKIKAIKFIKRIRHLFR